MKRVACLLTFCLLCLVARPTNPLLQQAEKAYDSKKYKEAIASYEKLVKEGYKSYQLYFNLGNAYYRNSDLGKAIYYYELARKLQPDDEDVRINLGIAASKTVDKIDSKENFFISAVKTNVLSSLSTNAWAWLTIVCISAAALLFFVFVSSTWLRAKRLAFLFSLLFLLGFVVVYGLGFSALQARYDNKFAIITVRETRIMNEPTASASGKFMLHEGTKIKVVDANGDWLLIRLDNGNEGWVKMSDVGVI